MTERLLQIAAIVALLWFGWQLAVQTVVSLIQANNRAATAEQQLREAQRQLATRPPAAAVPEPSLPAPNPSTLRR